MYQPFRIGRVFTNAREKKIVLQATHDILEETVNNKNIQIFEESSRTPLELNLKVDGRNIIAEMPDYPIPNTEYIVVVTNLLNVVEDELDRIFKRNVYFKSQVTSEVVIITPSNHETVYSGDIEWVEKNDNPNGRIEGNYYLEVATDIAFYNKVIKTKVIGDTKFTIKNLNNKQYYVRVRAENDHEFGKFSDTITFISGDYNEDSECVVDLEDEDIICDDDYEDIDELFDEPLAITNSPTDGSSPESFIISFNKDIDPETAKHIRLYRRKI